MLHGRARKAMLALLVVLGIGHAAMAQGGKKGNRGGNQGGGGMFQQGGGMSQPRNRRQEAAQTRQEGWGNLFRQFEESTRQPQAPDRRRRRDDDEPTTYTTNRPAYGPNAQYPTAPAYPNPAAATSPYGTQPARPNPSSGAAPTAPAVGQRYIEPDTRRIFVDNGTGVRQYTGEYADANGNTISAPPAAPAYVPPAAPAAPPPAPAVAATPAPRPTPPAPKVEADEPKPLPMAANKVEARLPAVGSAMRAKLRHQLDARIGQVVEGDLESLLQAALFQDADRDHCLELARARGATQDQVDLLSEKLDDLDVAVVRMRLQDLHVASEDGDALLNKLGVSKALRALAEQKGSSPKVLQSAVKALTRALQRQGSAPESLRAATEQLDQLARLREQLAEADDLAGGLDLGTVLPSSVFTVVQTPVLSAGTVLALAPDVLLTGCAGQRGGKLAVREQTAAELRLPILGADGSPVADGTSAKCNGVIISNAAANVQPIGYTIDGTPFRTNAGFTQTVREDGAATIAFTPGKGAPKVSYSLAPGYYEFTLAKGVWGVKRQKFHVTLDNSASNFPFCYCIDGQPGVVPARQSLSLERPYPATVVTFDRGGGKATASKLLARGTYAVRLNPQVAGLDLFEREPAIEPVAAEPRLAESEPGDPGDALPRFPLGDRP